MEDPYDTDDPKLPQFRAMFGPRNIMERARLCLVASRPAVSAVPVFRGFLRVPAR